MLLPRVCNGELLEALKSSLLGGSLPSLASALMFLSGSVHSAERLLPSLKKLNASLDLMTSALPQMAKADAIYLAEERRRRLTGQRSDHHLPWLLSLQKTMILLESRMAACLMWSSPSNALSADGPEANGAMEAGTAGQAEAKQSASALSSFSMLFNGGLEPKVLRRARVVGASVAVTAVKAATAVTSTRGATTTTVNAQQKPRKSSSKEKGSSMSKMFYDMGLTREGCALFASDFIRGINSAGEVGSWLEQALVRRDTNYKIALKQFRSKATTPLGLGSLEKAERTLVAAIMKHEGLFPLTIGFANAMKKTPEKDWEAVEPPVVLLSAWRAAGALRQWLLRQRSEFVSSVAEDKRRVRLAFESAGAAQDETTGASFADLVKSATLTLQILLCFEPADRRLSAAARAAAVGSKRGAEGALDGRGAGSSSVANGLDLPYNPPTILCSSTETLTGSFVSHNSARYGDLPFLQRHKKSKWKLVRTYFHTVFRWKALVRDSKGRLDCAKKNIGGLLRLSPYASKALDFCKKSHTGSMPTSTQPQQQQQEHSLAVKCWSAVIKSQETGFRRAVGLASLVRILRTTSLASAKEDVLECLIPVLSYVNTSNGVHHRFDDTIGCSEVVYREIRTSYYSLFKWATNELARRTKGKGRNQYLMTELRGSRYFLLLLELWSVPLTLGDYQHIGQLGIFEILERVVVSSTQTKNKNKNGHHRRLMSFGSKDKRSSIYPREVVGASWRLLRLMLANLASASQSASVAIAATGASTTTKGFLAAVKQEKEEGKQQQHSFACPTSLDNLFDVLFNFSLEKSRRILPKAWFALSKANPQALVYMNMLLHGAQRVDGIRSPVISKTLSSSGSFAIAFWMQLCTDQDSEGHQDEEVYHKWLALQPLLRVGESDTSTGLLVCKRGGRLVVIVCDRKGEIMEHVSVSKLGSYASAPSSTSASRELGVKKEGAEAAETKWWTHVVLSLEQGGTARLYVNGIADLNFDFDVGEEVLRDTVTIGNFEGSDLQKHFRDKDTYYAEVGDYYDSLLGDMILSSAPIEEVTAKALCDAGPPELASSAVRDKEVYQVWVALKLLVSCPIGRCALSSRQWLQLFMAYVQCGTLRLQQLSLRILSDLVSHNPNLFEEIAESVGPHVYCPGYNDDRAPCPALCNGSFLAAFLLRDRKNLQQREAIRITRKEKCITLLRWFLHSAGYLMHPLHRFDPALLQNTHRNELTQPEDRGERKLSPYDGSALLASEIIYFLRSVVKGEANADVAQHCFFTSVRFTLLDEDCVEQLNRPEFLALCARMGAFAGWFGGTMTE